MCRSLQVQSWKNMWHYLVDYEKWLSYQTFKLSYFTWSFLIVDLLTQAHPTYNGMGVTCCRVHWLVAMRPRCLITTTITTHFSIPIPVILLCMLFFSPQHIISHHSPSISMQTFLDWKRIKDLSRLKCRHHMHHTDWSQASNKSQGSIIQEKSKQALFQVR